MGDALTALIAAGGVEPRLTRYIPHQPTTKQAAFLSPLTNRILEVLFGGAAGGGKALALDTPLPTPTGWTTMGEVQVGDELLDERGQPVVVLAATEAMRGRECFEVRFSDGAVIIADADHRWLTSTVASRQSTARAVRHRPPPHPEFARPQARIMDEVVSTRDIAGSIDVRGRTNHAIATALPLSLPERDLPVDPYLLGVWLGDGDTRRAYFTTADPEVLDGVEGVEPCGPLRYRVSWLRALLVGLGLCGTKGHVIPKFIPAVYLRASAQQRLALLQGIVDSDGTVNERGQVEVTWTSAVLVEGLLELLASLGIKATARASRATLYGRDIGPRWRVKWLSELPCARLDRKLQRQKQAGFRGTHAQRYIVAADPTASVSVRCIAVSSPSRLFLAGRSMIPTHNSDALLMSALQYVDSPGYAALLLRRTYADLALEGALMNRAEEWLRGTPARWSGMDHRWTFPSGATLTFGYIEHMGDEERYASAEFQMIGFDELTQFPERAYRFLFSRLRQTSQGVPIRMRAATNPNGIGRDWVHRRFISPGPQLDRMFIASRLEDNPHLNLDEYERSLRELGSVEYRQLRLGDWEVRPEGRMFKRDWFTVVKPEDVPDQSSRIRCWDMAATETPKGSAARKLSDPDWTAGLRMARSPEGRYFVEHVARFRADAGEVNAKMRAIAEHDTRAVPIEVEQEGGAAGKILGSHLRREVFDGYQFRSKPSTGSKEVRAAPVAARAEAGDIALVEGPWINDFLDEICEFPEGLHDDQVDAFSAAYAALSRRAPGRAVPPGSMTRQSTFRPR